MVNDGSFFETIQVVYEENLENFKEVQKFRVGSAVTVRGLVVPTQMLNNIESKHRR